METIGGSSFRVLIIDSNADDTGALRKALRAGAKDAPFSVTHAATQAAGMCRLRHGGVDIVLVDVTLPDSVGSAAFGTLFRAVPNIPIVLIAATPLDWRRPC